MDADCAVCAEGYAPATGYSCLKCSSGVKLSAIGLTATVIFAAVVMLSILFTDIKTVVNENEEQGTEEVRDFWEQRYRSCHTFLVNMLPLAAIKIVLTVWQILSQVREWGVFRNGIAVVE